VVTILVSLMTRPRDDKELVGLVYSLTQKQAEHHLEWWKRPATLGIAVIVMSVLLNIVFF
jgi:solute:Na+ symporter, SSS family